MRKFYYFITGVFLGLFFITNTMAGEISEPDSNRIESSENHHVFIRNYTTDDYLLIHAIFPGSGKKYSGGILHAINSGYSNTLSFDIFPPDYYVCLLFSRVKDNQLVDFGCVNESQAIR